MVLHTTKDVIQIATFMGTSGATAPAAALYSVQSKKKKTESAIPN